MLRFAVGYPKTLPLFSPGITFPQTEKSRPRKIFASLNFASLTRLRIKVLLTILSFIFSGFIAFTEKFNSFPNFRKTFTAPILFFPNLKAEETIISFTPNLFFRISLQNAFAERLAKV